MKRIIILFFCLLAILNSSAQDLSLHLDGHYNNVRTGIGFLKAPWTLETWIKGDDFSWKETEVIIGGGEYSTFKWADNYPLVVKQGKLYSTGLGIGTSEWLDDQWHHVALTCDGKQSHLLLDGVIVATKDTIMTIIPGSLGITESSTSVFGGNMDEVRIWNTSLSQEVIKDWMSKELDRSHPSFSNLVAYYNFNTVLDDTALNWVGSGYLSYHLRNGRVDYYGKSSLAYTEPSTNKKFKAYVGDQRLFNAVSVESEWDAERGDVDNQIMKLRIIVQGKDKPLTLQKLVLDLSDTERLKDLSTIKVYATGKTARSPQRDLLYSGPAKSKMVLNLPADKKLTLTEGANYILVAGNISPNARIGNRIRVRVESFVLDGQTYQPSVNEPNVHKEIICGSQSHKNCFRVLQWNIWHGGNHVPLQGHDRIVDLIKASKAEIITMEEGYGFQEELAERIGFNLQTPSPKDNLCMFSRFPIEKLPTANTFCSNPGIIHMGDGRDLLVDDCWVRYSYRPDYTGSFPDSGHDVNGWVSEDSILPMADTHRMLEKDINPILAKKNMPVILGGDFNSGSHLDWTKKAAKFHFGYGPVPFPTSRYLLEKGYKDSFREIHPDEVARPEGSFAGIYGQLDFSRIDFLYYKGQIKAVNSKIVQTSPEIDDIWASDHSAVLTTFQWQ